MEKGIKYKANKDDVIRYFGKLPTTKTQQLIVRQKGHPLGDWIVSKPTRKHEYFIEII